MSKPHQVIEGMLQAPQLSGDEEWLDPWWEAKEWPADLAVSESLAVCILVLRGMDYPEYLQTDHWQAVRARCMKRARGKCQICLTKDAVDADHTTYKRRGFERPEDVQALCRRCHKQKHEAFKIRLRAEIKKLRQ